MSHHIDKEYMEWFAPRMEKALIEFGKSRLGKLITKMEDENPGSGQGLFKDMIRGGLMTPQSLYDPRKGR